MFAFFKRQQKNNQTEDTKQRRKPLAFSEIVDGMGDFSDLAVHDVQFKFWLPEAAKQALQELSERHELSSSEFFRQFLAVHCYGLYAFNQMTDRIPKLFKEQQSILFSIVEEESPQDEKRIDTLLSMDEESSPRKKRVDTYWIPELGKNVAPIKVWIPKRMKDDLQTLAEHVALTPSNYVREILISRLLGHGMLPQRITMFKTVPAPAADDWVEDKEIRWREVSEEDFRASTCDIKEMRTERVDSLNECELN
jgi:hypothetical protein